MEYSSNDVKQLFRSVYTLVKQQDECKSTLSVSAMQANDFLEEHRQLVGRCVTLLFEDYETVGKKAREILWRKGYYDLISVFKKHHYQLQQQRKHAAAGDVNLEKNEQLLKQGIERLLLDGMNHLKVIVLRLAQIFNLDNMRYLVSYALLENYDDELLVRESSCYENLNLKEERNDDEKKVMYTKQEIAFAFESIHSLLTALGDLHRYYCEFGLDGLTDVKSVTASYYWEAFKLNTKVGITQNQLGTLYNGDNYNLDSVYHYLYSLCCQIPFECSEMNVCKIFQKNIRYLESNSGDEVEEEDYAIREFVAKFLLVVDVFFYDKSVTDFTSLCHSVLIDFKNILGARHLVDDEFYMTDDLIFKIVSILFFCMYKVKVNNSEKIYSLNAFMVALCSELLEYCTMALEKYVVENVREDKKFREMYMGLYQKYDEEVRRSRMLVKENTTGFIKDQKSSSGVEEGNGSEDHSNKENDEADKKSQTSSKQPTGKKKHARRRRRALSNESESDLSDADDQSDFQLDSDSDEDDVSSISSFESYDDFSDQEDENLRGGTFQEFNDRDPVESDAVLTHTNELSEKEKNNNNNSDDQGVQLKFKKRYHKLNPNIVIEFAENERTMRSLKLLFDWLHTNMDILIGCYQSNPEFIHNIMKLLNHFNIDIFSNRYYFPRNLVDVPGIREDFRTLFEIRRTIPLDEDIAMKHFPLFETAQDELDWETNYRFEVSSAEQSFLRAMKMVDFGFSLCKSKKFDYAFCPKARDFSLKNKKQRKQPQQRKPEDHKKSTEKGITRSRNRIRKREQHEEKRRLRKHQDDQEQRGDLRTRRNRDRNRQRSERRRIFTAVEGQKSSQEGDGTKVASTIITKKGYLKNRTNGEAQQPKQRKDDSAHSDTTADETHQEKNINELMGQLWLRNEVKALESKVKRVVNITLTPYLMLDSKCLTEYTYIVKNLVKTKKFVILIPTAVLSDLDELKKHSDGARNAIKWLEYEFSKGNRFLRSQKNHEILPMPLIKVPRKLDRDSTVFYQIVQFCNHIVSNHADKDSTDIVTYLSGESLQDKKLYNSSYIGILEAIPVKFEQIITFYSSYKRK
ncbi:nonsense-mediated mRNA decay factor SMG5-like [Topomyia yanbarensis]|uniref:nonsense-mediated mRNA decay factor SMG5-like n=1 Tax=Topomyia yanbarensis TaxID=2498891 RepID=UPI00273B924C|nr:nonsense-mediated mRNA decay factor SMG5-like [Topomyia yanbarensis]